MSAIAPTGSVMQIAASGIRKAVNSATTDAHVVANSQEVTSRETVEALIDARQQVLYTKAGARMIQAADEMVSSLLDIRA
jgi:hypothetical protein